MKYAALASVALAIIWIRSRRPAKQHDNLVKLAGEVGGWWEEALPG